MGNLSRRPLSRQNARVGLARLTVYSRENSAFVVSQSFGSADPGGRPDRSGPLIVVGCRYPWREFIADLHELADSIEHNLVEGPGDLLALEAPDAEPGDAA